LPWTNQGGQGEGKGTGGQGDRGGQGRARGQFTQELGFAGFRHKPGPGAEEGGGLVAGERWQGSAMARKPRGQQRSAAVSYHVLNRGPNREVVVATDADHRSFLELLERYRRARRVNPARSRWFATESGGARGPECGSAAPIGQEARATITGSRIRRGLPPPSAAFRWSGTPRWQGAWRGVPPGGHPMPPLAAAKERLPPPSPWRQPGGHGLPPLSASCPIPGTGSRCPVKGRRVATSLQPGPAPPGPCRGGSHERSPEPSGK
jgi:hypothetical protein